MKPTPALDLVLVWHLHQPDYRDHASGEFALPWVYLHAIKDYTDMAGHLERHPGMRAVINWVPVLLDQVEDYAGQFESGRLRDPLLRLLARDTAQPLSAEERALLVLRWNRGLLPVASAMAILVGINLLWAVLRRKGREYALLATMPPDPSVN